MCGVLVGLCGQAQAQNTWIPIDLGTLAQGVRLPDDSEGLGINSRGDVVGHSYTATGDLHAFLWTATEGMRDLGTLGGRSSLAMSVNDARQVAGVSDTTSGDSHAFLWSATTGMVDLGTLGGPGSQSIAINNAGQVIGSSMVASGDSHPFLWTASTGLVDLSAAVGSTARIVDINDGGQVLGQDEDDSVFLWSAAGGRANLGFRSTFPPAMNDGGQVAGTRIVAGVEVPFVWSPATGIVDLSVTGPAYAMDIDNFGRVAYSAYVGPGRNNAGVILAGSNPELLPQPAGANGPFSSRTPFALSAAGVAGWASGFQQGARHAAFWCRGGAPTISGASTTPNVLRPAYGQFVTVRVDYTTTTRCGDTASATLSVTSSEADDPASDSFGDASVVDDHTVRLRAERLLGGAGRTYTIRVRATDNYGFASTQDVAVIVPVDDGTAPMTGVTMTTSVGSPQSTGSTVVVSATGNGGAAPYAYRFWVQMSGGAWQVAQDWSASSTFAWQPTMAGAYNLAVDARRAVFVAGSEVSAGTSYVITGGSGGSGPMTGVSLTTSAVSPQPAGATISLTANGTGGTGPYLYRFWVQPWNGDWQVVGEWGLNAIHAWTPTTVGGYNLAVEARRLGAAASEVQNAIGFVIAGGSGGGTGNGTGESSGSVTGVTLTMDAVSPQPTGSTIVLTATGRGSAQAMYRFWVQPWDGEWQVVQNWGTAMTFAWMPSAPGGYNIAVQARGASSSAVEAQASASYVITGGASARAVAATSED